MEQPEIKLRKPKVTTPDDYPETRYLLVNGVKKKYVIDFCKDAQGISVTKSAEA